MHRDMYATYNLNCTKKKICLPFCLVQVQVIKCQLSHTFVLEASLRFWSEVLANVLSVEKELHHFFITEAPVWLVAVSEELPDEDAECPEVVLHADPLVIRYRPVLLHHQLAWS